MENYPFDKVWSRICEVTGWSRQGELAAHMGIKSPSVTGAKQRGTFPVEWAVKIALDYKVDIGYLLTGEGLAHRGQQESRAEAETPQASMEKAAQVVSNSINIQEMLNMTAEVLTSDTVYRPALAANIKAFHRSIHIESDNTELRNRVSNLEVKLE